MKDWHGQNCYSTLLYLKVTKKKKIGKSERSSTIIGRQVSITVVASSRSQKFLRSKMRELRIWSVRSTLPIMTRKMKWKLQTRIFLNLTSRVIFKLPKSLTSPLGCWTMSGKSTKNWVVMLKAALNCDKTLNFLIGSYSASRWLRTTLKIARRNMWSRQL